MKRLFLILLFILLFVLPRLYYISRPLDRDEGEYAYSAWIMRKGVTPYENSFLQKPPMIIYTYALGQMFNENSLAATRVIMLIFILLTTFFVSKIAVKEFGNKAFWISAFVFNSISILPVFVPYSANTEYFMLLPMSVFLFLYFVHRFSSRFSVYVLAGSMFALSVLYKPLPLFCLSFVMCVWLVEMIRSHLGSRRIFVNLLLILTGFIFTTLVVVLPFLISGSINFLIESVVVFNTLYIRSFGLGLTSFLTFMHVFFLLVWILFFILFFYVIARPKRWWFYLTCLFFCLVAIYQTKFAHYYLVTVPFLTLITTQSILKASKSNFINTLFGRFGLPVISMFTIVSIFLFSFIYIFTLPYEFYWKAFGQYPLFRQAYELGTFINKTTHENDRIYIVGTDPEIYFYSKRLSVSRFIINTPMEIDTVKRLDYQHEAINDLERSKPKIIIYSWLSAEQLESQEIPMAYYSAVNSILNNDYSFVGGYFGDNNNYVWKTDAVNTKLGEVKMAVYMRK